MSLWRDAIEGVREVIMLRHEVTDISERLKGLTDKHADTRERVIRIEALIEATMARRRLEPPS